MAVPLDPGSPENRNSLPAVQFVSVLPVFFQPNILAERGDVYRSICCVISPECFVFSLPIASLENILAEKNMPVVSLVGPFLTAFVALMGPQIRIIGGNDYSPVTLIEIILAAEISFVVGLAGLPYRPDRPTQLYDQETPEKYSGSTEIIVTVKNSFVVGLVGLLVGLIGLQM